MYDLQYVRRKRRRRIAAFVSLFAALGVSTLIITSFLKRAAVGTFTVSIQSTSVKLALSEDNFNNPTSYLRIDDIPTTYYEYSYKWFDDVGMDLIDNEENDYYYGRSGDETGMYYLKYTFFVKNIGSKPAKYDLSINLDESVKSADGKILDDTLRVMVFENNPAEGDKHDYEVYAKRLYNERYKVINKEGKLVHQAFISDTPNPNGQGEVHEDDDHPLATAFLEGKGKTIIKRPVTNFKPTDVMRYTVVYWLEGEASVPDYDDDGNAKTPEGASIKLSIDITASTFQKQ